MAYNVVFIGLAGVNMGVVICVPYAKEDKVEGSVADWTEEDKSNYAVLGTGVSDERGVELVWQAQSAHRVTKYLGAPINMGR